MGGWAGYAIRQGASLAIPLGFLNSPRRLESEADFLGLDYLYKSGYDPTAFVDFFEKIQSLEKKKPGTLSKIFSAIADRYPDQENPGRPFRIFSKPSPNGSIPPSSTI